MSTGHHYCSGCNKVIVALWRRSRWHCPGNPNHEIWADIMTDLTGGKDGRLEAAPGTA